jgi:hypothetical protein
LRNKRKTINKIKTTHKLIESKMKRGPQSGFSGFSGFAMGDKKRGRFEDTEERKRPPPAALLGFDDEEEAASDRHHDAKEEPNEEKQNVEAADAEDEVDPLDAFMEGIHDTVKKEKAGIIKPAQTKVRVVDFGCSSYCHLGTLYYDASVHVSELTPLVMSRCRRWWQNSRRRTHWKAS